MENRREPQFYYTLPHSLTRALAPEATYQIKEGDTNSDWSTPALLEGIKVKTLLANMEPCVNMHHTYTVVSWSMQLFCGPWQEA